jgi:hypothetical protein
MKCSAVLAFAAAILASAGSADAAGPNNAKGSQCFRSESYQDFRAVNDHAFNIRVNVNDYYRIELEGACPTLTDPDAVLITRVRGSDLICGPLDWDLRVRESGPGGIAVGCIVKSQRKLTPEEVAAIPPKEKP